MSGQKSLTTVEPKKMRNIVLPILKKFKVKRAYFFGSLVRKELKENSDVDIIIEWSDVFNLFDFVELKGALEKAVGKKVDLVENESIRKPLKTSIARERIRIL